MAYREGVAGARARRRESLVTDARWRRVKALFEAALERPPSERAAFLATAVVDDEGLRAEVESLLASDSAEPDFTNRLPFAERSASIVTPETTGPDPSRDRHLEGERIGPYQLISRIGSGGMGDVYRARDTRLDRTVAVKVLPDQVAGNPEARERFEREARAVAALNHPNICTLYDTGSQDGIDFLVMEYLEGQTLAARLEKGPLAVSQAIACAIQVVSALDRAHRAGIVHRDLKPGNIFLVRGSGASAPATAKLVDFGLAKSTETAVGGVLRAGNGRHDLTTPGLIMGTAQYMAPEQIEGGHVDARTDVFAFGLVLFEMVAGRKPFEGSSQAGVMAAILEREPPQLSAIQPLAPAALERIVSTCLAKDPDDRWQTARDLLRELQWLVDNDAERTAAIAVGHRKPRGVLAAAMVTALVGVGALGYFAGARSASAPPSLVRVDRLTDFPGLEEYPAIAPDGKSVAFSADEGGSRQIWVRLIAGGPPLQLTHGGGVDRTRPRWSPDSSALLYYSPPSGEGLTGTLWEVSALGGAPRRIVDSVADGDISHDGMRLAFIRSTNGALQLVVASRDGTNAQVAVRLDAGYSYVAPRWSPDDRAIAYQRSRMSLDDEVFVVSSSGGEPRGLTRTNNRMSGFAWLPDGSGLVVSSSRGSTLYYLPSFNLWTVSLNAGPWRQNTFGEASYLYPDIDRAGTLVATRLQLQSNIWRYPVGFSPTENVRRGVQVTRQTGQVRTPTVSPDDKEVAYLSDSGGHANLWVTTLETGERRQITYERDPQVSVGVPVWSPDGRHIAFASSREAPAGQNGYWLVNPDGSGLRNLRSFGGWATWSADSRSVYYSEDPRRLAISKVSIDGGEPMLVRADTATRPAIGSDGSSLYWVVELLAGSGLSDYEIRTASPENGPARVLLRIPGHRVPIWLMIQPVISPDGKWLALPLVDNGTSNIWAISTGDGTLRQLTDFGSRPTFIARRVSWSSDSRSIYAALGQGESDVVLLSGLVTSGR